MSQLILPSGKPSRRAVSAGKAMTTSPRELGFIIRMFLKACGIRAIVSDVENRGNRLGNRQSNGLLLLPKPVVGENGEVG